MTDRTYIKVRVAGTDYRVELQDGAPYMVRTPRACVWCAEWSKSQSARVAEVLRQALETTN